MKIEIKNMERYPMPIDMDCCGYPYVYLRFTMHSNILNTDVQVWAQISPELEDELLIKMPDSVFPKNFDELPYPLKMEVYEALKQVSSA